MPNKPPISGQKISLELLARAKSMRREITHTLPYGKTACQIEDPNAFIG